MCNVPMKMVSRRLTCQQAAIFTIKGGDKTLEKEQIHGGLRAQEGGGFSLREQQVQAGE